jgi:hypothetical protein
MYTTIFSHVSILGTGALNCYWLLLWCLTRPASWQGEKMMTKSHSLTEEQAARFAGVALAGIAREYPNYPGHLLTHLDDLQSPRRLHPAFYGCYDWHSAVHSHWLLVRLLRRFPRLSQAVAIRSALDQHLTAENLLVEADYFRQPQRQSFERPYGWTWLLKLAEELHGWADDEGMIWSRHLQPLVEVIEQRYYDFLPKQIYPIRVGTHANTAFGLAFALDFARTADRPELARLLEARALAYFGQDADYPAAWEPNGSDFLSPALVEADLLARILPTDEFAKWLSHFLPGIADGQPASLFAAAVVSDRSDPQIVHLDGLNLSRAWCMRRIATALPQRHPGRPVLLAAAERHTETAVPHVTSGHYVGEHWLASFAVYLLTLPDIQA